MLLEEWHSIELKGHFDLHGSDLIHTVMSPAAFVGVLVENLN